jgi:hypothetical protein
MAQRTKSGHFILTPMVDEGPEVRLGSSCMFQIRHSPARQQQQPPFRVFSFFPPPQVPSYMHHPGGAGGSGGAAAWRAYTPEQSRVIE